VTGADSKARYGVPARALCGLEGPLQHLLGKPGGFVSSRAVIEIPAPAGSSSNGPTPFSLIERLGTFQQAMTTEEVADLLNVSKLTVLRKAKRGTIPAFKVGRIFRFDPRTLANWLKKRGVQCRPARLL